jgi:hypothetical protein
VHLTRRQALLSAGGLLLSACTSRSGPRPAPVVDPDVALKAAAVARERALLAAYDTALATVPALAARLAPLRAEHLAHLTALGATLPSPTPTPTPAGSGPAPVVLQQLKALERSSAQAHGNDALSASRELAPVLASLAASEASHGVVL